MFAVLQAIAVNAFTESVRQPIYVVLLLFTTGLIGLSPALSAYTLDDDTKLLIDLGLSTIFLSGLILAAFTASGVLDREIRNHTVVTVLSKPIGRPVFILGKYLGVLAAIATATGIWTLVFLLTIRHGVPMRANESFDVPVLVFGFGAAALACGCAVVANYCYGRVFASSLTFALAPLLLLAYGLVLLFDPEWQLQSFTHDLDGQLFIALLLILDGLAVLSAVAVAASTRLGQIMTLTLVTLVVILGLTSDYLLGRFAEENLLARIGHVIIPNMHFHWVADALTQEHPVSLTYLSMVTLYDLFYIVAILGMSILLFQTRDLG